MFELFYKAAAWAGWLALAAFFLFARPQHKQLIARRVFLFDNPRFEKRGVWIHCASFGEARAIAPIVAEAARLGKHINISVCTRAGLNEARRLYPQATVRYLPFENLLPFWATPQDALIVFEAELWLALFTIAKKQGAKTALFNARIPDRSLRRYLRFRAIYSRIFASCDRVFAQSQTDRDRLENLGAKQVETLGNIKRLQTPIETRKFAKPDGLTTIAASTHEGEEALILTAWIKSAIGGRLLIAPRHTERFDAVWREIAPIAEGGSLSASRLGNGGSSELARSGITLIDSLGILVDLYAIADIVVLGGAFAKRGGHNPIEAAYFGCRIVTGEHIFHQKALFDELSGVIVTNEAGLSEAIRAAQNAPAPKFVTAIDEAKFLAAVKSAI
ncbi:3-deoxy-D-manno-octulosonic acid transferase [Campylobacterota bacterium]|nr:3-deoxy-D-manno-octulosonic acid transferase [Campylobacterota bacterium]